MFYLKVSVSTSSPCFSYDKRLLFSLLWACAIMKKGKRFMIPFCIVMLVVLVMIIAIWNHVTDFKTAYLQSYAFLLVVMNWFDDIVKRSAATVMYLIIVLVTAGIVVLMGKIWSGVFQWGIWINRIFRRQWKFQIFEFYWWIMLNDKQITQ